MDAQERNINHRSGYFAGGSARKHDAEDRRIQAARNGLFHRLRAEGMSFERAGHEAKSLADSMWAAYNHRQETLGQARKDNQRWAEKNRVVKRQALKEKLRREISEDYEKKLREKDRVIKNRESEIKEYDEKIEALERKHRADLKEKDRIIKSRERETKDLDEYKETLKARLLAEERKNAMSIEEEDELLREVTVDELDEQLSKEKEEYVYCPNIFEKKKEHLVCHR